MPTNEPFAYLVLYSRPHDKFDSKDLICVAFTDQDAKDICNKVDYPSAEDEAWLRERHIHLPADRKERGNYSWYMQIPAAMMKQSKYAPELRGLRDRLAQNLLGQRNLRRMSEWYLRILNKAGIHPWDGSHYERDKK